LLLVSDLSPQPICAEQWVRKPPDLALKLTECLSEPTAKTEVIEITKYLAVFLPEQIEWRIGVSHC
jgi:hypothetical protein